MSDLFDTTALTSKTTEGAPIILSQEQAAIVNFTAEGKGNMLVIARAGTGKTFTILRCIPMMVGRIAVVSYSYEIVQEIRMKIADAGLRAEAATFHGIGFAAVRRNIKNVRLDKQGTEKFAMLVERLKIPNFLTVFVQKTMSLAMQSGFGIPGITAINDGQAWLDMVSHFDLDQIPTEDDIATFAAMKGIDFEEARDAVIKEGCKFAAMALLESVKIANDDKLITFDEQIWLPLRVGMKIDQYDWVCVDEAQDSNAVRRELARRMTKPTGRRLWVGDNFQAIYGFTGASNDALEQIRVQDNCTVFPMTLTRRCPKAVVRLAQNIVSDFRTTDDQREGSVSTIKEKDFLTIDLIPGRDAVICRNTAPLVNIAYSLIRRGIPAHIEGKNIGAGLITLISRWKVKTLPALRDKLANYYEKQSAKLIADKKEMKAEALSDQIGTIISLMEGLPADSLVSDLKDKINSMFTTTPAGERPKTVSLMTAHRSKGREFDNVYGIGVAIFMPSKYAVQPWQKQQEENLRYVLYTRALHTYVDVVVTPKPVKFNNFFQE